MYAGILKKKIEVYRKSVVKNAFGEEVETYTKVHSYRAGVSHQSTSRTVINSEIQYPYTKFLVVRIYADILEEDIILLDDKYYRISSIEPNDDLQNKRVDIIRALEEFNITEEENDGEEEP